MSVPTSEAPTPTGTPEPTPTATPEPTPTELPPATATATPEPDASEEAPVADSMADLTDAELEQIATDWIAESSGLSADVQDQLQPTAVTRTMDAIGHVAFQQVISDVPVRGASYTVHIGPDGAVLGASTSLSDAQPEADPDPGLTEAAAVDLGTKAVSGTVEGTPAASLAWVEDNGVLRLGWQVDFATSDPLASYAVVVDATTGEVISVDTMGSSAAARGGFVATAPAPGGGATTCDPGPAPSACVFPVDPIAATGDFALTADEANATLVGVPLERLDDPAGGVLAGQWVALAPGDLETFVEADRTWGTGGRATAGFEAGMAYYWVDFTQALIQRLGFAYHGDDPVEVRPVDDGIVDNAFYTFVEDRIHLGVGSNGISEGEDAQGIIHEYGHALLQAAVPDITSAEGGAFHESFGDLVSFLTTLEYRAADPACLFPWAEEGQCLRRVDSTKVYPDDLVYETHLDGEIFSGSVYDVLVGLLERDGLGIGDCADVVANPCGPARDRVFAMLLGSLPFLTTQLTLNDAATAFATTADALFDGVDADLIAAAFEAHGLVTDGTPAIRIEGLEPDAVTDAALGVKIQHEYRGDLAIRFEVTDGASEQLCAGIVLDPSPEDDSDNVTGRYQLAGTDCEQYLPPGPEQQWSLIVADTLPQDLGELLHYTVFFEGTAYRAAGLPLSIPDADPQGIRVTIGGDSGPVPTDPIGTQGAVTAGIRLTHTYIGDLEIMVGVRDAATDEVLCSLPIREPEPGNSDDNLRGTADVSDCEAFYPPTPDQPWYLQVIDRAAIDEGTIEAFGLRGPDGEEHVVLGPVLIPDDDPAGAELVLEG